ncbi:hypothetical protein [Cytophaga aurantiaca]|uniref:hypothetical protein n=1 Tax=Cytophaga aurantiaca TaxID=29530 RepID=UPI00036A226D|nr:hypothetical protein [Cytophaga aurantiaca]
MKSFYLLVLAVALCAASCRAKEGEPGPAGQSALKQQGEISGTIAFTTIAGKDTSVPFSFKYFSSIKENTFSYQQNGTYTNYGFDFKRRDLQDQNCYINLNGYGYGVNDTESDPDYSYMEFSFLKVINGDLYEFSRNTSITVTNVTLDPATGRLTYDFSGTVYYGPNDDEATVTGKVDVTLNRGGSKG